MKHNNQRKLIAINERIEECVTKMIRAFNF